MVPLYQSLLWAFLSSLPSPPSPPPNPTTPILAWVGMVNGYRASINVVTRGEGGRVKSILCTTQFCSCAESKGLASRGGEGWGRLIPGGCAWFCGCLILWVFVQQVFFLWGFDSVGVWFCGCLILWMFYSVGVWFCGCLILWVFEFWGCLVLWVFDSVGVGFCEWRFCRCVWFWRLYGFLRVSLILKMGLIPEGVVESKLCLF